MQKNYNCPFKQPINVGVFIILLQKVELAFKLITHFIIEFKAEVNPSI